MKRKRGQESGTGAPIFILLLTLLIVVYILFLPAQERQDLLNGGSVDDNNNDDNTHPDDPIYNITLVDEIPGRLEYVGTKEYTHDLPSVNLYATTNAEILTTYAPFIVKNSWFDKKFKTITFSVEDPKTTENLQLSFSSTSHTGTLLITLNGYPVYEGESDTETIPPITLPKEKLAKTNTLEITVSKVGLAFWRTNKFTFKNVMITADVTDLTGQDSTNYFKISDTEFHNLDNAEIRFSTECSPSQIKHLEIKINDRQIYNAIPDCGQINPAIDITDYITLGQNSISFSSEKGNILIDQLRVKTDLADLPYPVYFFEIDSDQYDDINKNRSWINMTLEFPDDYTLRQAKFNINNFISYMYTSDDIYTFNLKPYIKKGSNSIKIEPYGDAIEIKHVEVHLE